MKGKRILSAVLSAALLLQLSPLAVFAEDTSLLPVTAQTALTEPAPEEPTPEPAGEETALPKEPALEETAVPMAAPTPEPTAEPTATPAPEETPAPDAAETPAPEPSAEPTAAPDPAAEVQALIDALPDEVTEDNAAAVEQALTDIDDAKQSLTDDELAGLDFARYDAAANALLALWGEAPTDAVETLDAYQEPTKDGEGYYQIYDESNLRWFAQAVKNGQTGISAILVNNIIVNSNVLNENGDLTSTNFTPWTPIGTHNSQFTGEFNGQNHTISGLYFNDSRKNYVGLFGCVGNGGTVKNVTLADSYVSGNRSVGGICGWNDGGTVQNCTSGCTVKGTGNSVGGICGSNEGRVLNCHNTGKVTGADNIGGVCGFNLYSILQDSDNSGKVTGVSVVGGVCGKNSHGTVNGCYNTVEVSGNGNVGGVCGWNDNGTVRESYNIREVSGTTQKVGGVCGGGSGSSTGCYYLDTRGTDSKGESKTELQFKNGEVAYLLQKALDDAATAAHKPTTQVWGQCIGNTGETDKTPVLNSTSAYTVYKAATGSSCKRYSNTPNQTFTRHEYNDEYDVCIRCGACQEATPAEGNYYEIHNQGQLRWFADQVSNKGQTTINARLMASFAMDSTEWTPIGTESNPFAGKFDGNGNTITGLTCTDKNKNYVGLVGYANGATIQNVTVQESSLNGNEYIGAVCGYIKGGTITGCHAVNTASGGTGGYTEGRYYGGIVGYITGTTNVTGCTNSGSTVNGGYYLGGIAGEARNATVQRCFNSGAVTCKYAKFGGIVGLTSDATVQDCGNTGAVTKPYYKNQQYGGIVGESDSPLTIQNCYNTDSNTAAKICGDGWYSYSNCYYLPGDTGSSGSTDQGITAKTQAQFASGEVAYLLQNKREQAVWGQKIGTDDYPKLGGDKVYQSAPCPTNYSNTSTHKDHNIGADGKCTACGTQCIAYTVTIPATVQLGTTATIKAKDVILPNGKTLNVKVAEGSEFKVALDGNPALDTCEYTVTDVTNKTATKEVTPLVPVLTAVSGESEKNVELQFNKPESTTYSGTYTGTVTFTVSVDNKSAS